MTASAKSSALYTSRDVNKYVQDARDEWGRVVPIRLHHVVVSGETVSGTVNMAVIPKNWRVCGLHLTTNGLSASAGVGQTPQLGDAGDPDRYMAATDFDAVNGTGVLAYAGTGYTPTSDTIVVLTYGATGTPVVGQIVTGFLYCIPGS